MKRLSADRVDGNRSGSLGPMNPSDGSEALVAEEATEPRVTTWLPLPGVLPAEWGQNPCRPEITCLADPEEEDEEEFDFLEGEGDEDEEDELDDDLIDEDEDEDIDDLDEDDDFDDEFADDDLDDDLDDDEL
jgi:hypothetical protein